MKKLLITLLALLLLVPLLVSCDKEETEGGSEDTVSASGEYQIKTPVKDMGGREFQVICWDFGAGSKSILGYTGEVYYNEENPSAVDDAKKKVIDYVETTYNCKIGREMTATETVSQIIREQVSSGLDYYEICFEATGSAATLAMDSMLIDLQTVSALNNLKDEWWDQNAVNDLSIAGKNFFACGDINTYDDQGTWCVLFNKNLKSTLGIDDDLYGMARDGSWTFDKLVEICRREGVTSNTNGDNVLDEKDRWAFGTETYNIYIQLVGAGIKISEKDDNDLPYLTVSSDPEGTYSVLADVLDFYNDNSTVMVGNAPPYTEKGFTNVWEATVHKAFIEGRELFYMCGLINVASFRQMEDEFGILPIPKYYDTQDRYHHTVSIGNSTQMVIPAGVKEVEDIGIIIQALAEQSMIYLTPTYYDIQLKYRDSRDDESAEMLDIIFDSRTFDLGATYNWGGIRNQYTSMDQNIASRFESTISSAETAMQDMIDSLTKAK